MSKVAGAVLVQGIDLYLQVGPLRERGIGTDNCDHESLVAKQANEAGSFWSQVRHGSLSSRVGARVSRRGDE